MKARGSRWALELCRSSSSCRERRTPQISQVTSRPSTQTQHGSTAVNGNAVKVIVTELMDVPVVSAITPPVVVRYVKIKMRAVRQSNTYHKLCGLILTANLVLMILAAVGVFRPGMHYCCFYWPSPSYSWFMAVHWLQGRPMQ